MHDWSGDFPYFQEVGEAADYIGDFCVKWGRIPVTQTKEKYGTVRVYCSFGCWGLHGIVKPQYIYYQWPKWTWPINSFSDKIISKFYFVIIPYQKFIYRLAYKKALKKWPMIRKEILTCADWDECLKGL